MDEIKAEKVNFTTHVKIPNDPVNFVLELVCPDHPFDRKKGGMSIDDHGIHFERKYCNTCKKEMVRAFIFIKKSILAKAMDTGRFREERDQIERMIENRERKQAREIGAIYFVISLIVSLLLLQWTIPPFLMDVDPFSNWYFSLFFSMFLITCIGCIIKGSIKFTTGRG